MAGNYGQNGQDWYNQRLNQIASMMSMQNTDPSYLAGALIGDMLRTPFQNWMENKVLPTISAVSGSSGSGGSDNNTGTTENAITDAAIKALSPNSENMLMTKEELLNNPIQGYQDLAGAGQAYNQQMDLARLAQQREQPSEKPPTQAEINEANNNTTNQAVTQEAQNQGGKLNVLNGLGQSVANNAVANVFGINPFQQASSLGTGGDEAYDEVMQNAMLREILKAKQDYAEAQQDNDTEGMQKAHDAAEVVRQMAKEYGIDVSAADSDVSIDSLADTILKEQYEKQQEADKQEAQRIRSLTPQELLDKPEINISPNAFYQRAYQELRDKGIPEYRARQRASDMAMQYEANYMTAMQNEFNTQGIDVNTGAMNPAGVDSIMRMAAANNPQIAQLLMSQYASPRDTWSYNRDIDKANINQALRKDLAMFNYQNIEQPKMRYNAELTDMLNANNASRRVNAATEAMNARLAQISRLVQGGYITPDEGKAVVMAMLGIGGGAGRSGSSGTNSGGSSGGYSMTPREQIALAGDLGYLMNNALIGAQGTDKEKAHEAVDKYMAEKEKYRAQLIANGDTDSIELLDSFGFVLNFIYAALHGDETNAVDYYEAFRNNPELKSYVSGIDLTKYDRLIEKRNKEEQKKQNKESEDKQDSYNSAAFSRANNISVNTPMYGDANYWNLDRFLNR